MLLRVATLIRITLHVISTNVGGAKCVGRSFYSTDRMNVCIPSGVYGYRTLYPYLYRTARQDASVHRLRVLHAHPISDLHGLNALRSLVMSVIILHGQFIRY